MYEMELLKGLLGDRNNGPDRQKPDFISNPKIVADYVRRYHEHTQLKPGDVVVWKDGMRDAKLPEYGEECVVLDVFETIRCLEGHGKTKYGEPSDMRLLFFKEHESNPQMPMPYAFDSHMFRKVR